MRQEAMLGFPIELRVPNSMLGTKSPNNSVHSDTSASTTSPDTTEPKESLCFELVVLCCPTAVWGTVYTKLLPAPPLPRMATRRNPKAAITTEGDVVFAKV